jgi:hypothetical protein
MELVRLLIMPAAGAVAQLATPAHLSAPWLPLGKGQTSFGLW